MLGGIELAGSEWLDWLLGLDGVCRVVFRFLVKILYVCFL
jgi:hypothetical protein